jgi:hypothetical protein
VNGAATEIRRRDPAVIAARAHHVLDSAARVHADWPDEGREAIGRSLIGVHVALEKYRIATGTAGGAEAAAGNVAWAMATLLICVGIFLGEPAAREMERNAAEVAA